MIKEAIIITVIISTFALTIVYETNRSVEDIKRHVLQHTKR